MKIILNDITKKLSEYYVQTLITLFLPCETFSIDEISNKSVYCEAKFENNTIACKVKMNIENKISEYENSENNIDNCDKLMVKQVFGVCFIKAAEKIFGFLPPWGIQTGIRPVKVTSELINSGLTEKEAIEFMFEKYLTKKSKTKICTDIIKIEKELTKNLLQNSCSLYVSIPFCPTRCKYCSFVSYTTKRLLSLIPEYIIRLCEELVLVAEILKEKNLKLKTIYFGGGTPSVLEPLQIEEVISCIYKNFDLSDLCEFTFEAGRPDTVTIEKLQILKDLGIERISINTQSANDEILNYIGRTHTFNDYLKAVDLARKVGFKTINTDMIAGLPNESKESFYDGMNKILEIQPENITVHSFTVKRSSEFKDEFLKKNDLCKEIFDMIDYSQNTLKINEYMPYYLYRQKNTAGNSENVGYSKLGHEGLYNILIMEEYHSIFAVGAGAVTKLVSPNRSNIQRSFSPKYPYEFLDKDKYKGFDKKFVDDFYEKNFCKG